MFKSKRGFGLIAAVCALTGTAALADYTVTQGSGTTFGSFVIASVHYAKHVLVDSTGAYFGTAANALRTDPTGTTTQPVSATTLPLPTGAATATNQTINTTAITNAQAVAGSSSSVATGIQGVTGGVAIDTVVRSTSTDIGASVQAITATTLVAATPTRRGFAIQNQTAGACYLNGLQTPTGSFHDLLIAAGAYQESKDSHVGTGALVIYCAQAGPVYGRQW